MGIKARRHPQGPLRHSTLVLIGDTLFWDKTRPPKLKPRGDDEPYICKSNDTSDALSGKFLGTTRAAHAIMERNETSEAPMRLWPNDFYPGRRIEIPTRQGLNERGFI